MSLFCVLLLHQQPRVMFIRLFFYYAVINVNVDVLSRPSWPATWFYRGPHSPYYCVPPLHSLCKHTCGSWPWPPYTGWDPRKSKPVPRTGPCPNWRHHSEPFRGRRAASRRTPRRCLRAPRLHIDGRQLLYIRTEYGHLEGGIHISPGSSHPLWMPGQ